MRASFDNQTPFSLKIEADDDEGQQLREKARAAIMRTRAKEFQHDSAGIELGYRYENSPLCVSDGSPAPPLDHGLYVPSTWPGVRAPHAWIADGRSTLDLFGEGFTLLDFSSKTADMSAFSAAASTTGMPLKIVTINETRVKEIYQRSLVLIRPDGHVAWRGNAAPANASDVVDRVRGV
jgi:Aromatic-ring hydroxylase, C-terminal